MKRMLIILLLTAMSALPAAAFTLQDTAGKSHTLEQYKGKWVLVNLWATWCSPCLKEIPEFAALYEARKGKDLMVLGVAVHYQDTNEVIAYAKKVSMSYPLVLGEGKMAAQFGNVVGLPMSFLYDPQGKLVLKKLGTLSKETIEKYLAGSG